MSIQGVHNVIRSRIILISPAEYNIFISWSNNLIQLTYNNRIRNIYITEYSGITDI